MRNRVLGSLGVVTASGVAAAVVACGGGGDTSTFDAGVTTGTVDSGGGTVGDDTSDATAPVITVGTGTGGGGSGDGGGGVDCDATPLACVRQVCGDGVIEPGETCDDGNAAAGDGCSASCQLEGDYYACVAGQPCVDTRNCEELAEAGLIKDGADSGCSAPPKAAVCGDGYLDPGEACDTGADVGTPASGCATDCSSTFDGYVCTTAGQDCTNTWICGDGKIEGSEACDEGPGNQTAGCSPASSTTPAPCTVTAGWACTIPGTPCVAAKCGDGIVAGNEQCDIGTTTQKGCDANCRLAPTVVAVAGTATTQPTTVITNYACSYAKAGDAQETCTPTVCGNGIKEGSEQCDNDVHTPARGYDGCSVQCQIEPSCPNGTCVSTCGDGIVFDFDGDGDGKPDEQCDDGNTAAGDGCSPTCQAEPGYACTISVPAAPAYIDVPVVYRDMLYSGTGAVKAPGDKTTHGYGHPDFEFYHGGPATPDLNMPALVNSVPVFQWDGLHDPTTGTANGIDPVTGMTNPNVQTKWQQLTVFTAANATADYSKAVDYTDWFADVVDPRGAGLESTRGLRVDGQSIRMVKKSDGSYVFDSNCDQPFGAGYDTTGACIIVTNKVYNSAGDSKVDTQTQYGGLGGFYPLDGKGWNAVLATPQTGVDQWAVYSGSGTTNNPRDAAHNFSFTTQFRYYFTYSASATPPTLTFSGDDDVWVFVDNARVLDLGGLHSRQQSSFTLNAALMTSAGITLQDGHVYEVDLFNAERHTNGSNFALTLSGFVKKTSVCSPVCGDGTRTSNEQCDNGTPPTGTNTDSGSYDSCTTKCLLGPHCGDKVTTTPQEQCDDGINQTPYATATSTACAPGCVKPAFCGDGALQQNHGEVCDNGSKNADNAYGGCTTKCALGPRCGDQAVQTSDGEVCDNGFNATPYVTTLATDSCAPGCKRPAYCGNGTVDVPYEICDNGANNSNTGAYDSCTTSCKQGPHCGDGTVQSPQEQCDDGNQRSGDGCSAGCQTETGGIR